MINFLFNVRKLLLKLSKVQWRPERSGRECHMKTGNLATNFGRNVGIFNASQPLQICFSFSKDCTILPKKKGQKEIL